MGLEPFPGIQATLGIERRNDHWRYVAPDEGGEDVSKAFFDAVGRITQRQGPDRLLVDCRAVERIDAPSRRIVYRRWREVEDWRIAVVGESRFQRFMVNFLMAATQLRNIHYFTDAVTAMTWLRQGTPGAIDD